MTTINSQRKNCRDTNNAFLITLARFSGKYEFPIIKPCSTIPNKLISFSQSLRSKNYSQWIHFYEEDYLFERVWKNPRKYLGFFKKFNGIILPDFSLYRDMPYVMQLWNIYRSRSLGSWFQQNGIQVIPNVRFGDSRTFFHTCEGISKNSVIAVSTYGTLKGNLDREILLDGLEFILKELTPRVLVIYGSVPLSISKNRINQDMLIVNFPSKIAITHKRNA